MQIRGLSCCTAENSPSPVSFRPPRGTGRTATAVRTSETGGSLSITTADGDQVTLSLSAASLVARSEMTARGRAHRQYSETEVSANSLELSIALEGEFDREELADIARLVDRFAAAAGEMGQKAPGQALERMVNGPDLTSLASFSYQLQYEESESLLAARYG